MTDTVEGRRTQGRSPSYPGIDLGKAIERARELWAEDKQFQMPIMQAMRRWGYSGYTGNAGLTLSALKKFGLLEETGSRDDRRVSVSSFAVEILNHPDIEARRAAIKKAALRPPIHQEMWQTYTDDKLPSDETIIWRLKTDRHFTDSGAADFVREYRRTIEFAELRHSEVVLETTAPVVAEDEEGDESISAQPVSVPSQTFAPPQRQSVTLTPSSAQTINVPLPGGRSVALQAPIPLTEVEWTVFIAVLQAMKPGLVAEAD